MDFELLVVRGRSSSQALKLVDGITTIGRQDDCHLRIKSSSVSRKHCELFEKKGMLLVKDLGSSNGTLVNGKKVTGQQVLEVGDEITIGGVKLQVTKVGASVPKKATSPQPAAEDTAVVEAGVQPGSDVEFEIDFDDPEPLLESDSAPKLKGKKAPKETKAAKKPASETASRAAAAAPEHAVADDAIADFLLDIKLDEDE